VSLDHDRLAKLLALSTSDSDGEALAAIRRANAMVSKAGLTWHQVLKQSGGKATAGKRFDPAAASRASRERARERQADAKARATGEIARMLEEVGRHQHRIKPMQATLWRKIQAEWRKRRGLGPANRAALQELHHDLCA